MDAFGNRAAYVGDYLRRAAESIVGWGGNDKIGAYYPMARFDSEGSSELAAITEWEVLSRLADVLARAGCTRRHMARPGSRPYQLTARTSLRSSHDQQGRSGCPERDLASPG